MKVLIIDDAPEIVATISACFQIQWPEAELISTYLGEEGVELVKREAPNVVVLDLGLPDISGFEVLKRIRLFSAVPVMILTVRSDEDAMAKGFKLGANDYMVKPFRIWEFVARIKVQVAHLIWDDLKRISVEEVRVQS